MENNLEKLWVHEALIILHEAGNRHDTLDEFIQDYENHPVLHEEFVKGYVAGRKKNHEELELQTKAREEILAFSLDYQVWANDFFRSLDLNDKFNFMTFQNMRRQAYTHAVQNGRNPIWGDPSYLSEEFGTLRGLEKVSEERRIARNKAMEQLSRAESVLSCINELDILGPDNQGKMAMLVRKYFQDKKDVEEKP